MSNSWRWQTGFSPAPSLFDLKKRTYDSHAGGERRQGDLACTKAIQGEPGCAGAALIDLLRLYDIYATLYGLAPGGVPDLRSPSEIPSLRTQGWSSPGVGSGGQRIPPAGLLLGLFGVGRQEAREKYMPEPLMLRFPEE